TAGVTKLARIGTARVGATPFGLIMSATSDVNARFIAAEFAKAKIPVHLSKNALIPAVDLPGGSIANLHMYVGPKPPPAFEEWVAFNANKSIEPPNNSATRE